MCWPGRLGNESLNLDPIGSLSVIHVKCPRLYLTSFTGFVQDLYPWTFNFQFLNKIKRWKIFIISSSKRGCVKAFSVEIKLVFKEKLTSFFLLLFFLFYWHFLPIRSIEVKNSINILLKKIQAQKMETSFPQSKLCKHEVEPRSPFTKGKCFAKQNNRNWNRRTAVFTLQFPVFAQNKNPEEIKFARNWNTERCP